MTTKTTPSTYVATDSWSAQPWPLLGTHPNHEAALDAAVSQVRKAVDAGDYDCEDQPAVGLVTVRLVAALDEHGKYTEADVSAHQAVLRF